MGNGGEPSGIERYIPDADDIGNLSRHCVKLVNKNVDGKPGVGEGRLNRLLSYGEKCESEYLDFVKSLPEGDIGKGNKTIVYNKMTADQLFVTSQLLGAIGSTMSFVETIGKDEKPREKGEKLPIGQALLVAEANRSFTEFFMNIQQRFDLNEENLEGIFNSIFSDSNLEQELEGAREKTFPGGIMAVIRSYMALREIAEKDNWPKGNFRLPSAEEDVYFGVDLIWESDDGTVRKAFQIKGSIDTERVEKESTDDVELTVPEIEKGYGVPLENIRNYGDEYNIETFWIRAPSWWMGGGNKPE